MRVYNREIGNASWASVEDYLHAGNALGYDYNWRFAYSGGELLMMGAGGVSSGYYPTDSNGVMVQNELSAPCKCPVFTPTALPVCPPLGYGGCEGGASNCHISVCIPGTCGIPGMPSPSPGTPPLPNPNSGYILHGLFVGLIVKCLANPLCRAALMCLAAALGAALGELITQLIQGTCCNWCSIGCAALCGCLALGAGIGLGRLLRGLLPPPLGELIVGGAAYGACYGCCTLLLRC